MALVITYKNDQGYFITDTFSDINTVIKLIELDEEYIDGIVKIQADGDELEHIYKMFSHNEYGGFIGNKEFYPRPSFIPKGKVVTLFGDLARTIVANLNYEI